MYRVAAASAKLNTLGIGEMESGEHRVRGARHGIAFRSNGISCADQEGNVICASNNQAMLLVVVLANLINIGI